MQYHTISIQDVLRLVKGARNGLSSAEAAERLEKVGKNVLPENGGNSVFKIFLRQFFSPLILILIFALVVSLFFDEELNALVIGLIVVVNIGLAFWEELKAERSLDSLKKVLPVQARVKRDGEIIYIPSEEVVPGDLVILKAGDKVVADGRLVSVSDFKTVEAALTGESEPQEKSLDVLTGDLGVSDRTNMVFSGTLVASGEAEVVITATGIGTEVGKITELIHEVKDDETPLEKQLAHLARNIGLLAVLLGLLAFAIGYAQGYEWEELLSTAIALAVAIVPEGLAIGLTVVLAIAMQRMLKRKALVRNLISAETLGGVQVICFDKTGTITTGEMTVVDEFWLEGQRPLGRKILTTVNCYSEELATSPTELALCDFTHGNESFEIVTDRLPFDSSRKFAAAVVKENGACNLMVTGAPEVLLDLSDMDDDSAEIVNQNIDLFLEKGYRILAVAEGGCVAGELKEESVQGLKIVGLLGIEDPVREDAHKSIKVAHDAGVLPIMITGDHPETARRVAERVGIINGSKNIITGTELDEMGDKELARRVRDCHVYARVLPRHKVRIVKAWHENGASVAMTGDGVNDAPAIRAADIGVAFGSGTEVAKEVADMVLLENKFSTITSAVHEGRIAFDNIRKVSAFMLIANFTEVILIMGSILLGLPLAITPIQILWINLIADGVPSIALMFEPGEDGVMKEGPRISTEQIISRPIVIMIALVGLATATSLLVLYYFMQQMGFDLAVTRSVMYFGVAMNSLIHIFAIRSLRNPIFKSEPWKNKLLIAAFVGSVLIQLAPLAVPAIGNILEVRSVPVQYWGVILMIALVQICLIEWVKWLHGGVRVKNHV